MPNGDTVRVEAKKKPEPVEEKSELEKAQITLFDLMGAGDES